MIYLAINIVAFLVCAWAALAVLTILVSPQFWKVIAAGTAWIWGPPFVVGFLVFKAIHFLHWRLDARYQPGWTNR